MGNFELDLPDLTEVRGATVFEHALPRDWRDVRYRRVGSHPRFVCDVMAIAFPDSWLGAIQPEDLQLEPTEVTGARQKKGINDIAWSASVPAEFQDGSPGGERVIVVIEVQWTVQWAMPIRVMQYEAMRAWQMLQGKEPVSRIKTIVLYTGEKPWDAPLDAGKSFANVLVDTRPRVLYSLVDLQRLEADPGTKNLAVLLAGVVCGDTFDSLTESTEALARRLAEVGDKRLEQDMFELVRDQAKEDWPRFDWDQCEDLAAMVRLLKEDAMTWPEKWMTQMRPNWKEEVRAELKPEVVAELRPEVKAELRPELRPEVKAELRPELKPEVKAELRPELKPEVEAELRPELRPKVEAELRAELRPKVEQQLREEIRAGQGNQ